MSGRRHICFHRSVCAFPKNVFGFGYILSVLGRGCSELSLTEVLRDSCYCCRFSSLGKQEGSVSSHASELLGEPKIPNRSKIPEDVFACLFVVFGSGEHRNDGTLNYPYPASTCSNMFRVIEVYWVQWPVLDSVSLVSVSCGDRLYVSPRVCMRLKFARACGAINHILCHGWPSPSPSLWSLIPLLYNSFCSFSSSLFHSVHLIITPLVRAGWNLNVSLGECYLNTKGIVSNKSTCVHINSHIHKHTYVKRTDSMPFIKTLFPQQTLQNNWV